MPRGGPTWGLQWVDTFPRSNSLPCKSVESYPVDQYADEAAWEFEDELDLGFNADLKLRSGSSR